LIAFVSIIGFALTIVYFYREDINL
jgi:hypothetical protein